VKAVGTSILGKWDTSLVDATHDMPATYTLKCVEIQDLGNRVVSAPCEGASAGDWPAVGTVAGSSVTGTLSGLKVATAYMCYAIAGNTAGEACSSGSSISTGREAESLYYVRISTHVISFGSCSGHRMVSLCLVWMFDQTVD
jgi:hypothetical protein